MRNCRFSHTLMKMNKGYYISFSNTSTCASKKVITHHTYPPENIDRYFLDIPERSINKRMGRHHC